MPLGLPPLRIGLAASVLHRAAPNGALFRLLGPLEQSIREELRAELFVLGQTYDALVADGVLADYPRLTRLPARRDGGLIHLMAAVMSGDPARRLDAVIYLLDPDDPTSVFRDGNRRESLPAGHFSRGPARRAAARGRHPAARALGADHHRAHHVRQRSRQRRRVGRELRAAAASA
jgi:hypothetical protein